MPDTNIYEPIHVPAQVFAGILNGTENVYVSSGAEFFFYPPATTHQGSNHYGVPQEYVSRALRAENDLDARVVFTHGPSDGSDIVVTRDPRELARSVRVSYPDIKYGNEDPVQSTVSRAPFGLKSQPRYHRSQLPDKIMKTDGTFGYWFDRLPYPSRSMTFGPGAIPGINGGSYWISSRQTFDVKQVPEKIWIPYTREYARQRVQPQSSWINMGRKREKWVQVENHKYHFYPPRMPGQNVPEIWKLTASNSTPLWNRVVKLDATPRLLREAGERASPPRVDSRTSDVVHPPIAEARIQAGQGSLGGVWRKWKEQKCVATWDPFELKIDPTTEKVKPKNIELPNRIRYKHVVLDRQPNQPRVADITLRTPKSMKEAFRLKYFPILREYQPRSQTPPPRDEAQDAANILLGMYEDSRGRSGSTSSESRPGSRPTTPPPPSPVRPAGPPVMQEGDTSDERWAYFDDEELWDPQNTRRTFLVRKDNGKVHGHHPYHSRYQIHERGERRRKKDKIVPGVSNYLRYALINRHHHEGMSPQEEAYYLHREANKWRDTGVAVKSASSSQGSGSEGMFEMEAGPSGQRTPSPPSSPACHSARISHRFRCRVGIHRAWFKPETSRFLRQNHHPWGQLS